METSAFSAGEFSPSPTEKLSPSVLRVDSRDESDSGGAEELRHKTALQNALLRHWRIRHREEYDGHHPFV